jgi:hypothetical protein
VVAAFLASPDKSARTTAHTHADATTKRKADGTTGSASCRCAHKRPRPAEAPLIAADSGSVPCSPSCPDCPDGSDGPRCPCSCPDGCAMCNAAKVPCLAHPVCVSSSAGCLGDALPEPTSTYSSPCAGRVIRPPRA